MGGCGACALNCKRRHRPPLSRVRWQEESSLRAKRGKPVMKCARSAEASAQKTGFASDYPKNAPDLSSTTTRTSLSIDVAVFASGSYACHFRSRRIQYNFQVFADLAYRNLAIPIFVHALFLLSCCDVLPTTSQHAPLFRSCSGFRLRISWAIGRGRNCPRIFRYSGVQVR